MWVQLGFLPVNHPYPSRLETAGRAIRADPAAEAAIVAYCYVHIVAFDAAVPWIKACPPNQHMDFVPICSLLFATRLDLPS